MTATERISIVIADPHCRDAERLLADLSEEMAMLYPETASSGGASGLDHEPGGTFLIARFGDEPIGCGALWPTATETGHIGSLFVARAARRLGIGRMILAQLEQCATGLLLRRLCVEAGVHQQGAIALCEHAGYHRASIHGACADKPYCVCYEKELCEG